MEPSRSKRHLEALLAGRGFAVTDLVAPTALDLMLDFYADRRATGVVPLDEDGDMLLYEWGVFDFGDGLSFQFGLTRQFVASGEEGDDAISQLRLILHYEASAAAHELHRGHRWCSHPGDAEALRSFAKSSPAAAFVGRRSPARVELVYEHI